MNFNRFLLAAVIALLILPTAAAQARQSVSASGGTITLKEISDSPRTVSDRLNISSGEGNVVRFRDRENGLFTQPDSGCKSEGPLGTGGVECDRTEPFEVIVIDLGKGSDDVFTQDGMNVPISVTGATGMDSITTGGGGDFINVRDGEADGEIDCGPGQDIAQVDSADTKIRNCETIQRAGSSGPSNAEILAALKAQLTATARKLRGLFDSSSVSPSLRAPAAGTMNVKLTAGTKTIATGKKTYTKAGKASVKVTLTTAGKALLKNDRPREVALRLTFKRSTSGAKSITAKKVFKLKPL